MTNNSADLQLRKTARMAGFWYLIMAVTGAFSLIYVPSKIIVAGNAEATVNNIIANEFLFRLGSVIGILSMVPFLMTILYLYRLFKEVDLGNARLMAATVIISIPAALLVEMNNIAAIVLLGGGSYLSAFPQNQLHAMAMFFLNLNKQGANITGIFWGLWLFPFGILVYKSKFIPKVFGLLLLINGSAYLIESFASLLIPVQYEAVQKFMMLPLMIGEIPIMFWLLIIGIRKKKE